ncbi:MAG TPA: OmpA family protein [Luteimonas sp.]|nr:OmpA family protein [Luteimonas sp.]
MSTQTHPRHLQWIVALVALLGASLAFAADDTTHIKGMITAVHGDVITVKDSNNADQTITVTPNTVYKKTKGLTNVIHEKVTQSSLLPGLPISADVLPSGSGYEATQINFRAEDFKTAQQVQAGLAPTTQRMNDFGTYKALATQEVLFASGSTKISDKGKSDLMAFASKAKGTNGYHVELQGFTDSTGNVEANQRLSRMRAEKVANYLQQQGGLMPAKVHGADGMGVASDAGSGSNANARKVVVKLVVDKGVSGGS